MRKKLISLSILMLLSLVISPVLAQDDGIPEVTRTQFDMPDGDLYHYRYCEILPVYREGIRFSIDVYATISLNQCPAELWDELDADELAETYGAVMVIMNGPRYWVLNRIAGVAKRSLGEPSNLVVSR